MIKSIVSLAFILISSNALAGLANSNLEPAHQKVLAEAAYKACGAKGDAYENQTTKTEINVDNGVTEYKFTSDLYMYVETSEYAVDTYTVKVESYYFDAYDHQNQVWGSYTVLSATCNLASPSL